MDGIPHEKSGFVDPNVLVEQVVKELDLVLSNVRTQSFKEEIVSLLSTVGALEIRSKRNFKVRKIGYYLTNDDVFDRVLEELGLK